MTIQHASSKEANTTRGGNSQPGSQLGLGVYPNVSASAGILRFSLAVDADNYMIFRNITSTDFIPILEPKWKVSLVLLGLLTFRGSLAAIDMAFERTFHNDLSLSSTCMFPPQWTAVCFCQN